MYAYIHVYTGIYIRMYIHICTQVYTCVHTHVHMLMYVHPVHIHTDEAPAGWLCPPAIALA